MMVILIIHGYYHLNCRPEEQQLRMLFLWRLYRLNKIAGQMIVQLSVSNEPHVLYFVANADAMIMSKRSLSVGKHMMRYPVC